AAEPGGLVAGGARRGRAAAGRVGRGAGLIDRSLLWTGRLNELALGAREPRRVGLYDTTLRDGEQSVGVVLGPEEKLEIAKLIDGLGIERIEVGFPRVSDDDR